MKKFNEDFEATVVNPISYFSNKSITGFKGEIDLTNRVMGIITMGKTMGKGWGNPRFFCVWTLDRHHFSPTRRSFTKNS